MNRPENANFQLLHWRKSRNAFTEIGDASDHDFPPWQRNIHVTCRMYDDKNTNMT